MTKAKQLEKLIKENKDKISQHNEEIERYQEELDRVSDSLVLTETEYLTIKNRKYRINSFSDDYCNKENPTITLHCTLINTFINRPRPPLKLPDLDESETDDTAKNKIDVDIKDIRTLTVGGRNHIDLMLSKYKIISLTKEGDPRVEIKIVGTIKDFEFKVNLTTTTDDDTIKKV